MSIPERHLGPRSSDSGPWTRSSSIPWDLVRNVYQRLPFSKVPGGSRPQPSLRSAGRILVPTVWAHLCPGSCCLLDQEVNDRRDECGHFRPAEEGGDAPEGGITWDAGTSSGMAACLLAPPSPAGSRGPVGTGDDVITQQAALGGRTAGRSLCLPVSLLPLPGPVSEGASGGDWRSWGQPAGNEADPPGSCCRRHVKDA